MWYVRPAKTQISLRIHAVWSEPFLVAWIFYECYATDWTSFWVSKLKRRLHRLVWVWADPQGASLCDVFLFFCHFPKRGSGSGVILIVLIPDICVLPYFLYSHEYRLTRNTVYCAILSDQIVVGCPLGVPISYYYPLLHLLFIYVCSKYSLNISCGCFITKLVIN